MVDDLNEYLATLGGRAAQLSGVASGLREGHKHRLRGFEIIKEVLHDELARLACELATIDAEVATEAARVKRAVLALQQLALREHLQKLDDNIETWQLHSYITKEEFLRQLQKR